MEEKYEREKLEDSWILLPFIDSIFINWNQIVSSIPIQ